MERINSTPEAKNLGSNVLISDIHGKYFGFSQISLSCKLKFLRNSTFLRNSVCLGTAFAVHRGVFWGKTPWHTSQYTPNSTPGPLVGSRELPYPEERVSQVGEFLRNFLENAIFEKLIPKIAPVTLDTPQFFW